MRYILTFLVLLMSSLSLLLANDEITKLESRLRTEEVDSLRAKSYLQLGVLYATKNPALSKSYLDSGLFIANHHKYPHYIAIANANFGVYYSYRSNYVKALEYYLKALSHFETVKDTARIEAIMTNLGLIHINQKHYSEAMTLLNNALKIDKSDFYHSTSLRRLILMNIGSVYSLQKDYNKAKAYYKQSLLIGEFIKDENIIRGVSNNLADIYLIEKKPDSAYFFLNKGMVAQLKSQNIIGLSSSHKAFAKYYLYKKDYPNALKNLNIALSYSKQAGYLREISDIYLNISAAHKAQNNFKGAYEAYVNYKTTADSIYNERITRELAQNELQYEFDKKQKKAELDQIQRKYNTIILVSILCFLLVIAILLYFLMQRRMNQAKLESTNLALEKKTLEQDLELKNRELTANIMYLLQKNELISSISDKLKELKRNQKSESQEVINGILAEINSSVNNGVWEEFEVRFLQVHKNFYENLLAKHPDLSAAELKLCAFLRLNISTKDISTITHQNPKSIEVARSRLRKKLNINNLDINLVVYLMDF